MSLLEMGEIAGISSHAFWMFYLELSGAKLGTTLPLEACPGQGRHITLNNHGAQFL